MINLSQKTSQFSKYYCKRQLTPYLLIIKDKKYFDNLHIVLICVFDSRIEFIMEPKEYLLPHPQHAKRSLSLRCSPDVAHRRFPHRLLFSVCRDKNTILYFLSVCPLSPSSRTSSTNIHFPRYKKTPLEKENVHLSKKKEIHFITRHEQRSEQGRI